MKKELIKLIGIMIALIVILNSCSDSTEEADPCQNGPELSVDNITISIEGQSSGAIEVSASNGTSPYMYSIDGINFQNSGSFTDLEANDYTITVRDANSCTDSQMATVTEVPEVSYANEIRPIIETSCQLSNCHGDRMGIPSFATYADVSANANGIKFRTGNGSMPPAGPLPDAEVQLISDWVDQGAPDN
jgi:hypothetical protein